MFSSGNLFLDLAKICKGSGKYGEGLSIIYFKSVLAAAIHESMV